MTYGVAPDYAVKILLEKNLIQIVGRKEVIGKPLMFGTTQDFLKHFNLKSINDLPTINELKSDEFVIEEEEEIDEETRLKMQLEEYKLFKEAGVNLQQYENVDRFYKQPDKSVGDARIVFNQFNLDKLLDAFAFILMKTKDRENPTEKKISKDRWTVADKIAFLNNTLKDNKEINFFSLFDDSYSKIEVVTVFLAFTRSHAISCSV